MSSIRDQLVLLAELANIDVKAKVVADKLGALPADAVKAKETAKKLQTEFDSLELKKRTLLDAKKIADGEMQEERSKIRKWESRAKDIRGEREHTALTSEISTAKRAIRRLEDDVLTQMESLESVEKDLAASTKKAAAATETANAEWAKVEDELVVLRGEIDVWKVRRQALVDKLPIPLAKRYDMIAGKRAGVGVALIRNNDTCAACNRAVPPQLSLQIQKGLLLETCPACQRLLVHHTMTQAPVDGEKHA
jgi:uncharacterized protein